MLLPYVCLVLFCSLSCCYDIGFFSLVVIETVHFGLPLVPGAGTVVEQDHVIR